MIRIAVATFPGTSSENYSPCNHANGGCNLERGTPSGKCTSHPGRRMASFRSAGRDRASIWDSDDDRPGPGLCRLPNGVLCAAEARIRIVRVGELGDAGAQHEPGVVVRRTEGRLQRIDERLRIVEPG